MKKKNKIVSSHSLWFTGYPSSGKTTLAKLLIKKFKSLNIPAINLDGDEIRNLFFKNKKYDKKTRVDSVNFYISLISVIIKSKIIVIVSANHAFDEQRKLARKSLKNKYSEIWLSTPLKVCEKRDVKKLYKKAKKGKIKNLVGYDLNFDKPRKYELELNTNKYSKKKCLEIILKYLKAKKVISHEK